LGSYANGVSKQIGVKNLSAKEIGESVEFLRAQTGRKSVKLHEQTPHVVSTQGLWTPKRAQAQQ
jgi:hypothetical protein